MGTLSDKSILRNGREADEDHAVSVRGAAPSGSLSGVWSESAPGGLDTSFLGVPVPKEEFPAGIVANEFRQNKEVCLRPRFTARFEIW